MMKYKFKVEIEGEGREAIIKSLRAHALYLEDEVTDDELEMMAITGKPMPNLETFRIEGLEDPVK